jgi:ankyrin repeat protein
MSLINAVKNGNVNAIRKLLNNGANVNQADEDGWTALMQASILGRAEIVKFLLAKGANVNKASKKGVTPLYHATVFNHPEVVKLLLAAPGIDVNKAFKGSTPLVIASKNGHTDMVKLLLAAPGIDVNKADKDGRTPLIHSVLEGSRGGGEGAAERPGHRRQPGDGERKDQRLCSQRPMGGSRGGGEGAAWTPGSIDANKADVDGDTPLIAASYRGRIEIVKFLLAKGADVNKSGGKAGDTPLIIASWKGHTEIVKLLLANGADASKMDKDGETALYSASEEDHAGIVEILLKAGADPNKANNKGETPLFVATRGGHVTSVRALLKSRGIQVDQADKDGWTPLMIASQYGAPFCARALLKAGADPNKAKPDGVTALHVASFNDKVDVVKELLAAKDIDPFKKNRDGKTALDQAKSESVRKLLREAMGITTRWRNMNAEQRRGLKPMLLKRMIAKGLKNGKNATFTEPIIYANYSYRTLKPVNNKNKNITSFGLVIDDKNNVKSILDLEGATRAMRNVRERANREG